MQQQQIFREDLPLNERIAVLQESAEKVEEKDYFLPLSAEALDSKREEFAEKSIELSKLQDAFNEVKQSHKLKIEPVQSVCSKLLEEIKTKQEYKQGIIYHLANHEDNQMETYDHQGVWISSRRLLPNEKISKKIFAPNKNSENQSKKAS